MSNPQKDEVVEDRVEEAPEVPDAAVEEENQIHDIVARDVVRASVVRYTEDSVVHSAQYDSGGGSDDSLPDPFTTMSRPADIMDEQDGNENHDEEKNMKDENDNAAGEASENKPTIAPAGEQEREQVVGEVQKTSSPNSYDAERERDAVVCEIQKHMHNVDVQESERERDIVISEIQKHMQNADGQEEVISEIQKHLQSADTKVDKLSAEFEQLTEAINHEAPGEKRDELVMDLLRKESESEVQKEIQEDLKEEGDANDHGSGLGSGSDLPELENYNEDEVDVHRGNEDDNVVVEKYYKEVETQDEVCEAAKCEHPCLQGERVECSASAFLTPDISNAAPQVTEYKNIQPELIHAEAPPESHSNTENVDAQATTGLVLHHHHHHGADLARLEKENAALRAQVKELQGRIPADEAKMTADIRMLRAERDKWKSNADILQRYIFCNSFLNFSIRCNFK